MREAICLATALAVGLGTAASAASLNGTVNSGIGAKGAHAGVNGNLHSRANIQLRCRFEGRPFGYERHPPFKRQQSDQQLEINKSRKDKIGKTTNASAFTGPGLFF